MKDDQAPAFVDTNILVYAFDRAKSRRNLAARALIAGLIDDDRIRISTQVLQELFVTLTRKVRKPCTPRDALARIDDLAAWPVFVVDYPSIREAARLSEDAILSFWDALIIVAAAGSGAKVLYTEDLNHGQEILGIKIHNPFATGSTAPAVRKRLSD